MPDNPPVEQDRDLIRRMGSKDVAALDAFYERYNRLAFSLLLQIVGSPADAEDLLVDVFWQVFRESSDYDASRGKPVVWLLTIARTRAIESLRGSDLESLQNKMLEDASRAAQTMSMPDALVRSDIGRAVQEALRELSGEQRVPLEMAYFKGMSHTQIASALRQPRETVKAGICTSVTHLRKRLSAHL